MKSLTNRLIDEANLSLPQVYESLELIEDWLSENYPVLAKLYHHEIAKEAKRELIRFDTGSSLQKAS